MADLLDEQEEVPPLPPPIQVPPPPNHSQTSTYTSHSQPSTSTNMYTQQLPHHPLQIPHYPLPSSRIPSQSLPQLRDSFWLQPPLYNTAMTSDSYLLNELELLKQRVARLNEKLRETTVKITPAPNDIGITGLNSNNKWPSQ